MTLQGFLVSAITCSTACVHHGELTWSGPTLWVMPAWVSPWKPLLLLHWSYTGAASWLCYMRLCYMRLCYGYIMAVSARREVMLWLLWQPWENKCVGSSYNSWSLLPASEPVPCPTWVQWTVHTMRYSQAIGTETGSVTHYGFPSSLVWIWELDHKKGWVLKS